MTTNPIVMRAEEFAKYAHRNQVRKYTGEPYFNHLKEVYSLVRTHFCNEDVLCAALLHDALEDTATTYVELVEYFGIVTANLVLDLTDISKPEDGNRAARKKIDREFLHSRRPIVQFIKCADIISNTASIVEHDPDFAKVYLKEKELLLDGMHPIVKDHPLWRKAKENARSYGYLF